jgi:hypothetical protein
MNTRLGAGVKLFSDLGRGSQHESCTDTKIECPDSGEHGADSMFQQ